MTELGAIAGAIMSQLGKGRSQADLAVLEIAKRYKEFDAGGGQHLLADFPIPRFSLDEVIVDLKLAISETPLPKNYITPEAKSNIISRIGQLIKNIPTEHASFQNLTVKSPLAAQAWTDEHEAIIQKITAQIPDNAEITPETITSSIMTVLRESLTRTVLSRVAKIPMTTARSFVERHVPQIETEFTPSVQNIVTEELKAQPDKSGHLGVLVTASELQSIPHEKITNVRLTLHESDRTWTEYDVEEGKTKEKLIPS